MQGVHSFHYLFSYVAFPCWLWRIRVAVLFVCPFSWLWTNWIPVKEWPCRCAPWCDGDGGRWVVQMDSGVSDQSSRLCVFGITRLLLKSVKLSRSAIRRLFFKTGMFRGLLKMLSSVTAHIVKRLFKVCLELSASCPSLSRPSIITVRAALNSAGVFQRHLVFIFGSLMHWLYSMWSMVGGLAKWAPLAPCSCGNYFISRMISGRLSVHFLGLMWGVVPAVGVRADGLWRTGAHGGA